MPEKPITLKQASEVVRWKDDQKNSFLASIYPDHVAYTGLWTVNGEPLALVRRNGSYTHLLSCSNDQAIAIERAKIVRFRGG